MSCDHPAFAAWIEEARGVGVVDELTRRGFRVLHEHNGPCPNPGCGGTDRFAVNLRKNIWICRASGVGGDAIALCRHLDGTSFLAAVETLTGRPPPGRDAAETLGERRERELRLAAAQEAAHTREAERAVAADRYREAERRRAHDLWRKTRPIGGTPVAAYLARRGLEAFAALRIGYLADAPLWDKPAPHGAIVHRGPAMVAPIIGPGGRFAGVHMTWIDLAQPGGKAVVVDADTGELLPAKKIRGSKRGGRIELGSDPMPERLYLGEGIETVLSVRQALARARPGALAGALFWSSVDLGNMAGRAAATVPHPTERIVDSRGRARPRPVPGPEPDRTDQAIPIPDGVRELVILGDGDSEPVRTRFALERAAARFARIRPDLTIRIAMAPAGRDFNDLLREDRAA